MAFLESCEQGVSNIRTFGMAADSAVLGTAALRRLKKKKQKEKEKEEQKQNLTKIQSVPGKKNSFVISDSILTLPFQM